MLSRKYAALVYLLEENSFPVTRLFATKDSDLERTLKKPEARNGSLRRDKAGQAATRRPARAWTNGAGSGTTAGG